ncbi:hypothetical protein, partial [Methylobacterium nigriterrae]|uniref:hypothetical protein n=1 Tax=Methylobacterium nigriterrae TaxID=3127512 RepID=UPI0030134DFB
MSADHDVVRRIREGIASRQDQPGGWQALLDEATEGAGCSVIWDGVTVANVTVWDEPPRLSHRARDHHTVPFGHLDAQKAGE